MPTILAFTEGHMAEGVTDQTISPLKDVINRVAKASYMFINRKQISQNILVFKEKQIKILSFFYN